MIDDHLYVKDFVKEPLEVSNVIVENKVKKNNLVLKMIYIFKSLIKTKKL